MEDDASPARGGEFGVDSASDPLMDLARSHPEAAVGFMRTVLLLGLLTGALLPIPCFAFLGMAWEACEQCNRPLHLWVLVHCGLNLLQAPARLHFYRRLGQRPDAAGVQQVVQSGTWKGCQTLSLAGYAWFIVGIIWLINSNFQGPCRGLYLVSLGLVCASLLKPLLTIAAFRRYVPAQVGESAEEAPRGASDEVISKLPVVEFVDDGRECSCAVCLVDFEEGESLRKLPCGHKFHAQCIDTWLARCSRCPLCMQEVERSHAAHSCARC